MFSRKPRTENYSGEHLAGTPIEIKVNNTDNKNHIKKNRIGATIKLQTIKCVFFIPDPAESALVPRLFTLCCYVLTVTSRVPVEKINMAD